MEMKASQFARQVMEKNTKDVITKMSSTLSTRANKFHGELKFKLNVINGNMKNETKQKIRKKITSIILKEEINFLLKTFLLKDF
jgi:hypothetical protein